MKPVWFISLDFDLTIFYFLVDLQLGYLFIYNFTLVDKKKKRVHVFTWVLYKFHCIIFPRHMLRGSEEREKEKILGLYYTWQQSDMIRWAEHQAPTWMNEWMDGTVGVFGLRVSFDLVLQRLPTSLSTYNHNLNLNLNLSNMSL